MSDPNSERAWALLQTGRPADALDVADEVLASDPDDVAAAVLVGTCLVKLGRFADADQVWRRATAAHPADVDVAVLGVRCAWHRRRELWRRAERMLCLDPNNTVVLFWYTLAAAHTKHRQTAYRTLHTLQRVDPLADMTRQAEIWVDLIVSDRAGRPAVNAERLTAELLADDPNSAAAHDLRLTAAQIRSSRRRRGKRAAALAEVDAIRAAAAAGVQPEPGRLRHLTAFSVGAPALAFLFAAIVWLVAISVDGGVLPWPIAAMVAAAAWGLLWSAAYRRLVRLVRSLPAVGRQRTLRPAVRSATLAGAVVVTLGFVSLLALRPFDRARAADIGFAKRTETRTVVDYVDAPTIPSFPPGPQPNVFSTIDDPLRPGDTAGTPVLTAPPLVVLPVITTPPVQIPQSRTVEVERHDPDAAIALMRYYTTVAVLSFAVAGGFFVLAYLAHRAGLRGPPPALLVRVRQLSRGRRQELNDSSDPATEAIVRDEADKADHDVERDERDGDRSGHAAGDATTSAAPASQNVYDLVSSSPRVWEPVDVDWLDHFARAVADSIEGTEPEAAAIVSLRYAAGVAVDAAAWHTAARDLADISVARFAVAPFARALELQPGEGVFIEDLAMALNDAGNPAEAARVLRTHPAALQQSLFARLLLAEFAAKAGDLSTTRALLHDIGPVDQGLAGRSHARVGRADALAAIGRQGAGDLRWWEAVLNGSLLLHLADNSDDHDDDMNGRYGMVWDSPEALAGLIDQLRSALTAVGRLPGGVVFPADRDSEILAAVIAGRMQLAPPPGQQRSGDVLAVCFDWATAPEEFLDRYRNDPTVVLFAHHLDGDRGYRITPDVIGFEAQAVTPAWGERMRMTGTPTGSDRPEIVIVPADTRPPPQIAADVTAASADPAKPYETAAIAHFVEAFRTQPHLWGLTGGRRDEFQRGPIRSARFV